jgi:hypothetical protein
MKVKFIKDAVIHVDGLPKTMFDTGAEVELPDASGDRWLRRGVAVLLGDLPPDPSAGTVITPPAAPATGDGEPAAQDDGKKKPRK